MLGKKARIEGEGMVRKKKKLKIKRLGILGKTYCLERALGGKRLGYSAGIGSGERGAGELLGRRGIKRGNDW